MRIITKTITKTITLYNFSELSEAAKEKVAEWYLDDPWRVDDFSSLVQEQLANDYSNSDLDIEFDFSCTQGSGFNIYGNLSLPDVWEKVKDKFTEKENKYFAWAFDNYDNTFKMPENRRCTYCLADQTDFLENLTYDMQSDAVRGIKWDLLDRLNEAIQSHFSRVCREYYDYGYDYFYTPNYDEISEGAEINSWEFYENGDFAGCAL